MLHSVPGCSCELVRMAMAACQVIDHSSLSAPPAFGAILMIYDSARECGCRKQGSNKRASALHREQAFLMDTVQPSELHSRASRGPATLSAWVQQGCQQGVQQGSSNVLSKGLAGSQQVSTWVQHGLSMGLSIGTASVSACRFFSRCID